MISMAHEIETVSSTAFQSFSIDVNSELVTSVLNGNSASWLNKLDPTQLISFDGHDENFESNTDSQFLNSKRIKRRIFDSEDEGQNNSSDLNEYNNERDDKSHEKKNTAKPKLRIKILTSSDDSDTEVKGTNSGFIKNYQNINVSKAKKNSKENKQVDSLTNSDMCCESANAATYTASAIKKLSNKGKWKDVKRNKLAQKFQKHGSTEIENTETTHFSVSDALSCRVPDLSNICDNSDSSEDTNSDSPIKKSKQLKKKSSKKILPVESPYSDEKDGQTGIEHKTQKSQKAQNDDRKKASKQCKVNIIDQRWRDMRSILSPAFTGSKLKGMLPLVHECSKNLVDYLNAEIIMCSKGYVEVNVSDLFTRYTNDVIASCAFGLQVNSAIDENNPFYKMAKKLTSFTFVDVLKSFVVVGLPFVNKFVDISLFSKEAVNYLTHIILSTMKNRDESNCFRPDLIQILLEAKKGTLKQEQSRNEKDLNLPTGEESTHAKGSGKQVWTDTELVAQALVFFFAGFDTVASAVTLLLHEMSLNIDIQSKLRQEIDHFYEKFNGKMDYEKINQVKYLDMVVAEGLRKWPPAPVLERICQKPFNLGKPNEERLNDYHVEKDAVISIPVWPIHHDPEYYPEPEKFEPERFSDDNVHNIKPFTYLPFGLGPRHCIGSRFATIEMKVILFELLHNFEVIPGPRTDVLADLDLTSFSPKMNGGHHLRFTLRKKL